MTEEKLANANMLDQSYINVPVFEPIFSSENLRLSSLIRHFLIMGETGSGKTFSGVNPILRGVLSGIQNENGTEFNTSLLVIDPKQNELITYINALLDESEQHSRIVRVSKTRRINFFEGLERLSLRDKADRIFDFSVSFSVSAMGYSNREFAEFAKASFLDLLICDEAIRTQTKYTTLWGFLNETLRVKIFDLEDSYLTNMKRLIEYISDEVKEHCNLLKEVFDAHRIPLPSMIRQQVGQGFGSRLVEQFFYQKQYFDLIFKDYCNAEYESLIFLDPFECGIRHETSTVSIKDMILGKKIIVFSPDETMSGYVSDCVGMLTKSIYFKFAIETYQERLKTNIVVLYVCDEFQRFISCDEESGEQSFLDRCRAYNIACVLSTQSISSLRYALKIKNGVQNRAEEEAVNVISINTGNKLYFKSTDRATHEGLRSMYPHPPIRTINGTTLPHLLDIRPLTSLAQGECYYINSNGDCGKTSIRFS